MVAGERRRCDRIEAQARVVSYRGASAQHPVERTILDSVILAGYPYEFVGILYFGFYLLMGRKRYEGVYTLRSRVLTLLAAIVMVGCVPLHYAAEQGGIIAMFTVAIVSMISTVRDTATAKKRLQATKTPPPARKK